MVLILVAKYFQKKPYLYVVSHFYIHSILLTKFILQSIYQIKIKQGMILKLITLLIIVLFQGHSQRAILVLDQSTFMTALSSYKYLLVYYYDDACAQCTSTTTMYHTFNSLYTNWNHPRQQNLFVFTTELQFAQISLKDNEKIFANQKIESIPQFRLYKKDKKQPYKYPLLQYNYQNLWRMGVWIKRITQKYFPIYESLQIVEKTIGQSSKYLIISNRHEQSYKYFVASQGYLQNLDINYIRVTDVDLDQSSIMLKNQEYEKIISQCISFGEKISQYKKNYEKCENMIRNFKYRGLRHWSDQIVDNLYNKNYQVVLVITSNETVSRDYVRQLSDIKDQLDEQYTGDMLPLFVVADIYYDLQSSITIKRYIGAFDIRGYEYQYPMMAYLWQNEQGLIIKHMYQKKCKICPITQYTIKQWLFKAMKHQLKRDLRGQIAQVDMKAIQNSIKNRNYIKIYCSELIQFLQKYTNPKQDQKNPVIYLFILWRTNFDYQLISHKIIRWWQKQTYKTPIFSYDFYDNEILQNINIESFPAFMVYYNNRYFQIKQGIKNQNEVFEMIKRIENNSSLKK